MGPFVAPAASLPAHAVAAPADVTVIAMDALSIAPDPFTVAAGEFAFGAVNERNIEQELVICRDDVPAGAVRSARSGTSKEFMAGLEAGSYRLICEISEQAEAGIVGELPVEP
jgi:uncharacterized cupredoxin-like copper-binding protein